MSDNSYNGWKNYETWAVNMWLVNDEESYNSTLELAREVLDEHADDEDWVTASALADSLKELVDELPEIESVTEQATMACDLLRAALSEVDWYEIAQSYLDDVRENHATD